MSSRGLLLIVVASAMNFAPKTAAIEVAGVPVPVVTVEMRHSSGSEPLSVFNLPNGGGRPFTQAYAPGGIPDDATITVTVTDELGVPIAFFPFEDLWLGPVPDAGQRGLISCGGHSTADGNTDASGETVFAEPLFAGGQSTGFTYVVVSGDPTHEYPLALRFNSADIDGSGAVDLTDAGLFTRVLFGGYDYSADFNFDGIVNLSDTGYMAGSIGAACPGPTRLDR